MFLFIIFESNVIFQLHFVNINTKYQNVTEALLQPDGIAALGVFLEVNQHNIQALVYSSNVSLSTIQYMLLGKWEEVGRLNETDFCQFNRCF
jgi:hypothetical protein